MDERVKKLKWNQKEIEKAQLLLKKKACHVKFRLRKFLLIFIWFALISSEIATNFPNR